MFVQCRFSPDILVGWLIFYSFFFPPALLHTNHIFHSSGSVCIQQHSMLYLQHHQTTFQLTIHRQRCSILHTLHLQYECRRVRSSQSDSLFCRSASMSPFPLNSVRQGPTTQDFIAILQLQIHNENSRNIFLSNIFQFESCYSMSMCMEWGNVTHL